MATSFNNFSLGSETGAVAPYRNLDYTNTSPPYVGEMTPSETDEDDDAYVQHLAKSKPVVTNTRQTQNPGAATNLQNPQAAASSPVTGTGKMSDAPAYPTPQQPAATTGVQTTTASGQTRNTAPPLQNAPTTADPFQGQGVWTGQQWVPANHPLAQGQGGGTQPQAPANTQAIPVDHRTYQPPGGGSAEAFFNSLQPGTPVTERPGYVWQHNGSSWTMSPAGAAGDTGGGASQPPAFNPYPGYAAAPPQPGNSTYYADDLGNDPFSQYLGTQFNVDLPDAYKAGDITQWGGFDEGPEGQQMRALLQQILANPHTMNDQAVAGLKNAQKETADALRTQGLSQASSAAAASGRYGSGTAAQDTSAVQSDFGSKVLDAYRGIDIQKLIQDREDESNALQLGDTLQQSRFGRESEGFQNTLEGERLREQAAQAAAASGLDVSRLDFDVQDAQAGDNRYVADSAFAAQQAAVKRALDQAGINQAAADSGFKNWGLNSDNWNAGQDRNLAVYNADADRVVQNRQIGVTEKLGEGGLALDRDKLSESGRQFDKGYNLDYLNFLLNKDKFADSSSMGWASLNSNNINNWLNGL
jgi:hypothetical protein